MNTSKEDSLELIRTFLPPYLTAGLQENLFKDISENFPLSTDAKVVYSRLEDLNYYYQGDCLIDIPFTKFGKGKFGVAYISGVVVSNTCDIAPENERIVTPNIQFSAIFSVSEYLEVLKGDDISDQRVETFLADLKGNRISNLFYLPEKSNGENIIMEESFVQFDLSVALPIDIFDAEAYNRDYAPAGDRLVSFSNYGFYLFLIKLSVHYCRFREGVFRNQ